MDSHGSQNELEVLLYGYINYKLRVKLIHTELEKSSGGERVKGILPFATRLLKPLKS